MHTMRLRYVKLGGHVHCRVFTGMPGGTFAKNGELVFDEREWRDIERLFRNVEFIDEGTRDAPNP